MMREARHYAGVLVTAVPGQLARAIHELDALDDVCVHHRDIATERCVAVLESADRAGQERLFRAIQALAGVRTADLVYHLVDPESGSRLVLEESER